MKTTKHLSVLFLMLLTALSTQAQTNELIVKDIRGMRGKIISVPIYLTNTTEITSAQFNLELPNNSIVKFDSATVAANRRADHVIIGQEDGSNKYHFTIQSPTNKSLKGTSGKLCDVVFEVPNSLTDGNVYPIKLSDGVVFDVQNNNVVTNNINGTLSISSYPDFEVSGITVANNSIEPNGNLTINWMVRNVGSESSTGGWKENFYLLNDEGDEVFVGSNNFENNGINPGGNISRSFNLTLPKLIGIDGNVKVKVSIKGNSDSGEHAENEWNNIAITTTFCNLSKELSLTLPAKSTPENNGNVLCYLNRSGSRNYNETFTLSVDNSNRLSIPNSVTIGQNQSGVAFYANIIDDNVYNNDSVITITVSGTNYSTVSEKYIIEDNDYPFITLSSSKNEVTENEIFQITATLSEPAKENTKISFTTGFPHRFSMPSSVMVPQGESEISIPITVIQNSTIELSTNNVFYATADRYRGGEISVLLNDDDIPTLELTLTPNTINESNDPDAIIAKVIRKDKTDQPITIKLFDDSNGILSYTSNSIKMDAGVTTKEISLGTIDNQRIDGQRTVTITAGVYSKELNASATGNMKGAATAILTIHDNDGAVLHISPSSSSLLKGQDNATILTISRNTGTAAATVTISSDQDAELEYEHSATIPAGEKSITVPVHVKTNSTVNDKCAVVFTASSEGFTPGTCWALITEQSLPDATISTQNLSQTVFNAADYAEITVTVNNIGKSTLPAQTPINVYIDDKLLCKLYTQESIAAGTSSNITKQVLMPTLAGAHTLKAIINEDKTTQELIYNNNISTETPIKLLGTYHATVSTDKNLYQSNELVLVNGSIEGPNVIHKDVEIYFIHNDIREKVITQTDIRGNFTTTFNPHGVAGHYEIGACYPGEELTTTQDAFDIYGMKRTTNNILRYETVVGTPYESSVSISNTGTLPLHNITMEVLKTGSAITLTPTTIATLNGGATADIHFTLNATEESHGDEWQRIDVRFNSEEGVSFDGAIYYFSRIPTGKLRASVQDLKSSMTKGLSRNYPIQITNIGKGETGKIKLTLPKEAKWMTSLTGYEIQSLSTNETATIILHFAPTDDLVLHVTQNGTIGLSCETGEGLAFPYMIEYVNSDKGTLHVDVCDERTYYTENSPRIQNAKVTLTNPITGVTVLEGETNTSGRFSYQDLQEGTYTLNVTADQHDSYQKTITIDPGKENKFVVNLSYQSLTINKKIVEAENEGLFNISTNVEYDTSIPTPIITIDGPTDWSSLEKLQPGESQLFHYTLVNQGQLTAQDFNITFPGSDNSIPDADGCYRFGQYKVKCLNSIPIDMKPGQSWEMPIYVAKTEDINIETPHRGYLGNNFKWFCGNTLKTGVSNINVQVRSSDAYNLDITDLRFYGDGTWFGAYNDLTPSNSKGDYSSTPPIIYREVLHHQKLQEIMNTFATLTEDITNGNALSTENTTNFILNSYNAYSTIKEWEQSTLRGNEYKMAQKVAAFVNILNTYSQNTNYITNGDPVVCSALSMSNRLTNNMINALEANGIYGAAKNLEPQKLQEVPSYIQEYYRSLKLGLTALEYGNKALVEFFGHESWLNCSPASLQLLLEQFVSDGNGQSLATEALAPYKPENITDEIFDYFINRYNHTLEKTNDENSTNFENIYSYAQKIAISENSAFSYGYESLAQMIKNTTDNFKNSALEVSELTCASIFFQLSQPTTITRRPFQAKLLIKNESNTGSMRDVKLAIKIRDANGNIATSHEFKMNVTSIEGFTGYPELEKEWQLLPKGTGIANIQFIPTDYAAETTDKDYYIGGVISYTDPDTEETIVRELLSMPITVIPIQKLDMTFFMQRDLYGNDPKTTDVVEPSIPSEFAVLIHNQGYENATNVHMLINQPEVIENEKGLSTNYQIIGSLLNGNKTMLPIDRSTPTDIGDIPARGTCYAQWLLQSELMGHFGKYDITDIHLASYDFDEVSLANKISVHELIHSVNTTSNDSPITGWLVNDIPDEQNLPDIIYLSDGTTEDVVQATASITKETDTQYTMTLSPRATGWNYSSVLDPTCGMQDLVQITRGDGTNIDIHNAWRTDRTLQDGMEPLYEHRIHFADNVPSSNSVQTYTLTFAPRPEIYLTVDSVIGPPQNDSIVREAVTTMTVYFNKAVPQLTADKLRMDKEGIMVTEQPTITKVDEKTYTISYATATAGNAFYLLTIYTSKITDAENYTGVSDYHIYWSQRIGGLCRMTVNVTPEEGGTATPNTADLLYGTTVSLRARANQHYSFKEWQLFDEELSADSIYNIFTIVGDVSLTAVFVPRYYDVKLFYKEAEGTIKGLTNGRYEYGKNITAVAIPADGYTFSRWIINNETVIQEPELSIPINGDTRIEAVFTYTPTTATLSYHLVKGWNWISINPNNSSQLSTINLLSTIWNKVQEIRGPSGITTTLHPDTCYQILMTEDADLDVVNRLDNLDISTTLQPGWNWISYRPLESLPVDIALTNFLAKKGDIIKGQDGFAVYDGSKWIGTLENMHPGIGYQLYTKNITSFTYPIDPVKQSIIIETQYDEITNAKAATSPRLDITDRRKYADNMCIIADVIKDDVTVNSNKYTVGAYVDEECRGTSTLINDKYFINVYGQASEVVEYNVFDHDENAFIETNCNNSFTRDFKCDLSTPMKIQIGEALTGVIDINAEENRRNINDVIYDLQGRKVADSLDNNENKLPKGIYIKKGQKIIIQ